MPNLAEHEFKATMGSPMRPVTETRPLPPDFWNYVDAIPKTDFRAFGSTDSITRAYAEPTGRWHHLLLATSDPTSSW
jgi:hypothetical protein